MIFGTFDIVHHGHLYLFKQARKYGDHLTVVVARDIRVKKLKKKETVHTEKERISFLEQIRLIDEVVLGDTKDVYKVIKNTKPNVIVLGYDQTHFVNALKQKLEEFHLSTKVVRAKAYREKKLKTTKIRKTLQQYT